MEFHRMLISMLLLGTFIAPATAAEYNSFIGADAITMKTDISYIAGTETYEFTGVRLRYGLETADGASVGLEFIPPLEDEVIDPFGDLFRLEVGPSLGAYFSVGSPVYLRLGISIAKTEYSDVALGLTDSDSLTFFDIGLGFNISFGPHLTLYADIERRSSTVVDYPTFISGPVDHESELVSFGVNFVF